MSSQRHMIGRTVLELDSGSLADVWELQETISRLLQHQTMAALEPLFNEWAREDEVIRLDQVEVDLGEIAPYALEQEFVPALIRTLRETLGDRIAELSLPKSLQPHSAPPLSVRQSQATAHWDVLLYFLQYGRLPWWQLETDWQTWLDRWQAVITQRQTHASHWQQSLLQLLSEHATAQHRLIFQFPGAFCQQLIGHLHPAGSECLRLLAQAHQLTAALGLDTSIQSMLDRAALRLMLAVLIPGRSSTGAFPTLIWMRQWLGCLRQLSLEPLSPLFSPSSWMRQWFANKGQPWPSKQSLASQGSVAPMMNAQLYRALATMPTAERILWQRAMEQVLIPSPPNGTEDAFNLRQTADRASDPDRVLTQESESDPVIPKGRDRNADAPESPEEHLNSPQDTDRGMDPDRVSSQGRDRNADAPESPEEHLPEPQGTESWLEGEIAPSTSRSNLAWPELPDGGGNLPADRSAVLSPEETASGIYINQAGLVLIHPFLAAYFREVGLVSENTFGDETAQQTAIYLLHYLATRQNHAPEYELVLPKLLCGWPLNEAITPDISLSNTALEEGENLLQTVIDYWQALKSTSPDGLREGFLQRSGKLTQTGEQHWKLQIEQMAIDILLSRLPWGISMVKLPWVDNLLTVEWT